MYVHVDYKFICAIHTHLKLLVKVKGQEFSERAHEIGYPKPL